VGADGARVVGLRPHLELRLRVFIQDEAGSRSKHLHNAKTLELLGTREVSCAYPYAYGFVPDTPSGDGDNRD